jgi:hypothetical protein
MIPHRSFPCVYLLLNKSKQDGVAVAVSSRGVRYSEWQNYRTNPRGVAVPWLRRLVASLSPRRPGIAHRSVHVGCMVDRVALGQVFLQVLRFFPVSIVPPWVCILISFGGWTIGPLVGSGPIHSLTPLTWTTDTTAPRITVLVQSPWWCTGKRACHWAQRSRVPTRPRRWIFKGIKIRSTPSFEWEVQLEVQCRKILRHVKDLLKSRGDG